MFTGFTDKTIDFMWGLKLNNNREWFEAHKDVFKRDFDAPMKELGRDVFAKVEDAYAKHGFILKFSRIYKDARRVRGGEPYRANLWFTIEKPSEGWDSASWASAPGFWFELAPESWCYGMGYYQATPLTMAKLRARIDKAPAKFEKLIAPLGKQDEFILDGSDYSRKKESPSAAVEEWYNKKSFSLIHWQKNGDEIFSRELVERLFEGYRFLMPFYEFFVSLDSDPDPRG